MTLSLADVQRLAYLARLAVDDREAEAVRGKLASILGLIDQLNAIDTTGVVPMAHAQEVTLELRPDRATEPDRHKDFQKLAPAVENGLYLVPKVIE